MIGQPELSPCLSRDCSAEPPWLGQGQPERAGGNGRDEGRGQRVRHVVTRPSKSIPTAHASASRRVIPRRLCPEVVVRVPLKVMLQVPLDHLFRHLTHSRAEIPACPQMTPLGPPLQMRVLLEQFARRTSLQPPHDLTGRQLRRRTHQYVDVIPTHCTLGILISNASHVCQTNSLTLSATSPVSTFYRYFVAHTK